MNRTEQVAIVLTGAHLWGQWTFFHYYGAQSGASQAAILLAKDAQIKWQNWRNTHDNLTVERAQAVARITGEILGITREG